MRLARTILVLLALLATLFVAAAFAWLNPGSVRLDLGVGAYTVPVAYALIAAIAVGWLLGLATTALWMMRMARERRRLTRSVRRAESELEALNRLPARDAG
jgi:uncharacterized integral membrane protein